MLNIQLVKMQNPSSNLISGTIITYTIAMINNSTLPINNAVLLDTIPICTSFIENSVTINGIPRPGTTPSPPSGGVFVGNIPVGATSTLTFQVKFYPTPDECCKLYGKNYVENSSTLLYNYTFDPNTPNSQFGTSNSNIVAIPLDCNEIKPSVTKSVDLTYANIDDVIRYTISIKNNSSTPINNVHFTDTIPICTTFVANSLNQDAMLLIGKTPNPPGVDLPNAIGAGKTSTITFKVTAHTCPCTIVNNSSITYTTSTGLTSSAQSNTVISYITCQPQVSLTKYADKTIVAEGEKFTCSLLFKNNSNVTVNNVVVFDTLPICTTIVTTTCSSGIRVNGICAPGVNINPPTGVNIGSVGQNQTTTVTIDLVTVDDFCDCMKRYNKEKIDNSATAIYTYTVDPSIPDGKSDSTNSNILLIDKYCPGGD